MKEYFRYYYTGDLIESDIKYLLIAYSLSTPEYPLFYPGRRTVLPKPGWTKEYDYLMKRHRKTQFWYGAREFFVFWWLLLKGGL